MELIIIFGIALLLICVPFLRCLVLHPFSTVYYIVKDTYTYIKYRRWREYKKYGTLSIFNGLFGKGKTLSSTYFARKIYKKYNGKKVYDFKDKCWKIQHINVVTNVDIKDIPYMKLNSLNDIVTLSEYPNDNVSVWLVCIDEMSTQVNSREFKTNFTTDLLNVLLTCRHYRMQMIGSAQRFNHVDALVRQVTQEAIECKKIWRVVEWLIYDAWTVENTADVTKVKPKRIKTIFVKDKDFNSYDTVACVENFKDNVKNGKHLTDMEILAFQQGQASEYNELNYKRRYRKKLHS